MRRDGADIDGRAGLPRHWHLAAWSLSVSLHALLLPALLATSAFVWDELPAVRSMSVLLTPARPVAPAAPSPPPPAPPPSPRAPARRVLPSSPVSRPAPERPVVPTAPLAAPAVDVPTVEHSDRNAAGVEGGVPGGVPGGVVGGVPGGIVGGIAGGTGAGETVTPTAPPPPPLGPVRVGGDVPPPRKTRDSPPVYPARAEAAGIEGIVVVEATIDEEGRVAGARVLRSIPLLDGAALAAVRQWRFTPTIIHGRPVPVIWTTTVHFTLPRNH